MGKKKKIAFGLGAVVALVVAVVLGTGNGANAAKLITSAMIKNQTIQSVDIAEGGVGRSEVRNGSLTGTDMNKNTVQRFLAGERAQAENKDQDAKISDLEDRVEVEEAEGDTVGLNEARSGAGYTTVAKPGYSVAFNQCDVDGQTAIGGGYRLNGHASEAFSGADQNALPEGLTVVASEPAAAKGGTLVNSYQDSDFPQTEDGAFEANAWAVTFKNDTDHDLNVRVWAVCASVN